MSKSTLLTLCIVVIAFLSFDRIRSSSAQEVSVPNEGKIGDVKYSVLDPVKFREINGNGWVLLNGASIEASELAAYAGLSKLPDASGVFIRGMNFQRDPAIGDESGNRLVGEYQADSFQGHKHFAETNIALTLGVQASNSPRQRVTVTGANAVETEGKLDGGFGVPKIAKETRPRNIALYTYVKINDKPVTQGPRS